MATTISAYQFHCSFSGKEKDSETGYHYFGSRYYNSDLSLWISVDPMSDKYPSLSPYSYCGWSPIRLVDPNGREIGDFLDENGNIVGSDGKNDGKKYLLKMKHPSKRKVDSEANKNLFGISLCQ